VGLPVKYGYFLSRGSVPKFGSTVPTPSCQKQAVRREIYLLKKPLVSRPCSLDSSRLTVPNLNNSFVMAGGEGFVVG